MIARMKRIYKSAVLVASITLIGLLLPSIGSMSSFRATAASSTIAISPSSGIVGSKISVEGQGFVPNTEYILNWGSYNVSWILGGNPTEVTGTSALPVEDKLTSVRTDSSGSFTTVVSAPVDNGGKHVIQLYSENGTALQNPAIFTLEPSFTISPSRGPAGTPILVVAHGLGIGTYSTNYHVMWDNKYLGYMTAVTTHGDANFTFYAVGTIGTHYIDIYQGYPGPGYLNPDQNPSSGNWYPPYLPYQTTFNITSQPFTSLSGVGSHSSNSSSISLLPLMGIGLVIASFPIISPSHFGGKKSRRALRGIGKIGFVVIVVGLLLVGAAVFFAYDQASGNPSANSGSTYTQQVVVVRPQITVPTSLATSGPRINVSPNLATVGSTVNVTGLGFAPNSEVPVSWSTKQGNNLHGFVNVNRPLNNVTTSSSGSFSFRMTVPSDLEGLHFISVANLTLDSNASLYIERSATVTPSEGQQGTSITIQLLGTGWDYNTNIVAIDYDNAFVGYACGFNSQGNITVTIPAAGSPGVHSIDLYPSIYLGPAPPSSITVYRYPLVTPYDQPEKVPSFHFSFLITSANSTTESSSGIFGVGTITSLLPAMLGAALSSIAITSVTLSNCVGKTRSRSMQSTFRSGV